MMSLVMGKMGASADLFDHLGERERVRIDEGMKDGLTSENAGVKASKAVVEEFFAEVVVEGLL